METFLFRPTEYERLYNCSSYRVDQVPFEKRHHPIIGAAFVALFIVFEALYIPCIIVIWKRTSHSCYKFMFYIGCVDMVALWVAGFLEGFMAIKGAVFCSHPTIIYLGGTLGFAMWFAESTTAVLLALSRCVEMSSRYWADQLLSGWRSFLWLVPPTAYALYIAVFTMPVLFNGIYLSSFFNPHLGYIDDTNGVYHNYPFSFHNIIVLFALAGLYLIFSVRLCLKSAGTQSSSKQSIVFVQVGLISTVNAVAAFIYVYMQYFPVGAALILIGQLCWVLAHGLPPVIYLTTNARMRDEALSMVGLKKGAKITYAGTTVTHVSTVVPVNTQG